MENIPIIIVHKGNSFYLEPVLRQIRLFNPQNRICLISDSSTDIYDFIEHYNIDQYMEGANEFAEIYVHMSINPFNYELFCFQRWFVIRDFIRSQRMEYFLCLDSDVLLYCNVDEIFSKYHSYDFTICKEMGPCFSSFNNFSIEKLCNYMNYLYTDSQAFERLEDFYKNVVDGGVCDMTALAWYQKEISDNVIDIVYPVNNACFDGNISDPMGFETKKGKKKIYWRDNLPYGKNLEDGSFVQFYGLHLQGGAKHSMHKYILNRNKEHEMSLKNILRWNFSPDRLKVRLKEFKKIISSYTILRMIVIRKLKVLFQA